MGFVEAEIKLPAAGLLRKCGAVMPAAAYNNIPFFTKGARSYSAMTHPLSLQENPQGLLICGLKRLS